MALAQLILHGAVIAQGVELIVSALTIDDTYYYLGTAWNLKLQGFPTFDGIHPTNGVQLLWFWLLAGLAWLVPTKTVFLQAAAGLGALANVACHAVIWRFARVVGRPRLAIWMSGLWLLQSLGSITYSRGLENSVHALVFWCIVWQGTALLVDLRTGKCSRLYLVTGLLILNAWSRIDSGLLSGLLFAYFVATAWSYASRGLERSRLGLHLMATTVAAVAALGLQLAIFRWMGGSWLPVSALIKAGLEMESVAVILSRAARLGLPVVIHPLVALAALGLYTAQVLRPGEAKASASPGRAGEAGEREWDRLWFVVLAGIVVHAFVVHTGTYWYLAPNHVFWAVTLAFLADRSVSRVAGGRLPRLAKVTPAVFLALAGAATLFLVSSRMQTEPNFYALRARVGQWISENLPHDTVLASWNAGQLGYFSDQSLINLDGLANSADYYRRVLTGPTSLEEYLASNGVKYIVDRSDLRSWPSFPVVREFVLKEDEPQVLFWQVEPDG